MGWFPIESLSERLRAEVWSEYERRAELEPEERRSERRWRERQVRELVLRAIETDDAEVWCRVDALMFGGAATEAAPEAL